MVEVVLHGPAYSTYARTARLALEEKGVAYELAEVDLLRGAAQQPEHLKRHPFGKVPTFAHGDFALYETSAITRYIDEAFPGPRLQPADVRQRARMNQIIAAIDSYAYGALVSKIVIQRLVMPLMGNAADEAVIADALPLARKSVDAIEALAGDGPFLVGSELTLADLHLAPIFAYVTQTPEGKELLAAAPRLSRWWQRISARPSVTKTQPALG